MQQVFNPLLLYFQLVHFYNNAEKKRKSFRGKTPAFFLGVFFKKKRLLFNDREEFEPIFCRTKKSRSSVWEPTSRHYVLVKCKKKKNSPHARRADKRKYLLKQ